MPVLMLEPGTRVSCVIPFGVARKLVNEAFSLHISRSQLVADILTNYFTRKEQKNGKESSKE